MKRVWWGTLVVFLCVMMPAKLVALDTAPSPDTPNKVNGPLLLTAYSFSGHSLRYAQIYNSSEQLANLTGWKLLADYGATQREYLTLEGMLEPDKYATIGDSNFVSTTTFQFTDPVPAIDPIFTSVTLRPPANLFFNDEVAIPTVSSSTPRVAGTPASFHFARNVSTSTGNYLTTFTAFIPGSTFTLMSDSLYATPAEPVVRIVEIYPDAPACSPFQATMECGDYVKLFNAGVSPIDLSKYRLRTGSYGQSSTTSNTVLLSGTIAPGQFAAFALTLNASGSWVWLEDRYGTRSYDSSLVQYPSSSDHDGEAWSYNDNDDVWGWTTYPTPDNQPNQFALPINVNMCDAATITEIAANVATEDQFIEVVNPSTATIDLTGCALQTNRSQTASYVFPNIILQAGQHLAIYIKDTDLTLTKTTSGSVYLLSSDLLTEVGHVEYNDLKENTSWALMEGRWVQTYALTPNAGNEWIEYAPCDEGYVRNEETGLCNKVNSGETLADCSEGKYRSPETNRCRNLATTVDSLLTPCAVGQERNPDTNRCRSVGSTGDLQACAANQERNPATNRCRNRTTTATADFPIEAIAQSSEATIGWWAFGGVGTLAAGYAGWEWRREMLLAVRKVKQFIPGSR